jgi:hypothetical protein
VKSLYLVQHAKRDFLTLATGDIGFHRYVSLSLLP